ncbi:MAG: membrane dipeptidase [Maribacter litoralis]|uniref:membrane dipeptidase n=1 Tax=Maribacter litoralis TaxID=2059726 RepID=UPI003297AF33
MSIEKNNYVDLHCHPALKPYGKSFNYKKKGWNNPHRSRRNSIWKYDPPSLTDKLLNYVINLTKFSQSNFTSLAKGDVKIVFASLYPLEKGFFVNDIKSDFLRDLTGNFATGIGKKRIDAVQAMTNYFQDLEREYDFYKQLNEKIIRLPEGQFRYKLVNNYSEVEDIFKEDQIGPRTIAVVFTIEGLHVLNSNLNKPPNETDFLKNLKKIKAWDTPPLIVGLAHHFWNHLCGHAVSFTNLVAKNVNQLEGMDSGITPLGLTIIHELLDTTNGKRILVDIKHMNTKSRQEYYALLEGNRNYSNVPIVVTHGAANGLPSTSVQEQKGSSVAHKLNNVDINFYNDEIIRIARSKGIFGLQLDERRVASKQTLKETKKSVRRSKIMHYRSELLWNQIQHIAEVLDTEGIFAWDMMAIGSDFDGIIDPLNSFWTSEELPYLADFLERHAFNYMKTAKFKISENKIDADEIVYRIMSRNGLDFLKRNFI